jgi:hypothetical protein
MFVSTANMRLTPGSKSIRSANVLSTCGLFKAAIQHYDERSGLDGVLPSFVRKIFKILHRLQRYIRHGLCF